MAKNISILQPGYLPWLGFFEQMYKSEVFVIYDDIQYDKQGWRNRNRIKTSNGIQWLTVPVLSNFHEHPLTNEVAIDNKINWRKKHLEGKGGQIELCRNCPDWKYRSWKHNYWKIERNAEKKRLERVDRTNFQDMEECIKDT